jgi:hypothetical protein
MEWTQPDRFAEPGIWVLKVRDWVIAMVKDRGDGYWISYVNRHVRDWNRRHSILTPSRSLAMRCAERYSRAHLARILTELPEMRPGPCGATIWYPNTNPLPQPGVPPQQSKQPIVAPRPGLRLDAASLRRRIGRHRGWLR